MVAVGAGRDRYRPNARALIKCGDVMPNGEQVSACVQVLSLAAAVGLARLSRINLELLAIFCGVVMWCAYVLVGDGGPGGCLGIILYPVFAYIAATVGRNLAIRAEHRRRNSPGFPVLMNSKPRERPPSADYPES